MKEGRIIESIERPYEIVATFKNVFTKFGFFPFQEHADERHLWITAGLRFAELGNMMVILEASIDLECKAVQMFLELYDPIPGEKINQVNKLMGILNNWSIMGHLYTYDNQLYYHACILIRDSGFNREEFEKVLQVVLGTGRECCYVIKRVIDTDEDPNPLLGKLFSKMFGS